MHGYTRRYQRLLIPHVHYTVTISKWLGHPSKYVRAMPQVPSTQRELSCNIPNVNDKMAEAIDCCWHSVVEHCNAFIHL